ncbi:hypothetical protein [Lysinibacillus xylanilyticus]|uniref:hypothetical protein n=1 Tax=Lysinibacillus xylanilyticus TaxID=582475 RepID=UPI003D9900A0
MDEHYGNNESLSLGLIFGTKFGYDKGFDDGEKVGYFKGAGDVISCLGTYASAKLREGNGIPMAGYRSIKSHFDKLTEET